MRPWVCMWFYFFVLPEPRSYAWVALRDGVTYMLWRVLHYHGSADLRVSNVGVVGACELACRRMMRRVSQSSDIMEQPREGVGDQEPPYFTFEVSWEVANKGISPKYVCYLRFFAWASWIGSLVPIYSRTPLKPWFESLIFTLLGKTCYPSSYLLT